MTQAELSLIRKILLDVEADVVGAVVRDQERAWSLVGAYAAIRATGATPTQAWAALRDGALRR